MSDSLRPPGLKHARLPCPSLSLLEFAQTHVHWVSDAIQPSHPLLPPYPPALNLDSWGMKWTPVSKDAYLKIEGEESHLESLARRSWRERSNVMEAEETQWVQGSLTEAGGERSARGLLQWGLWWVFTADHSAFPVKWSTDILHHGLDLTSFSRWSSSPKSPPRPQTTVILPGLFGT